MQTMKKNDVVDVERGTNGKLYPSMEENPQLRWAFIRKVYSILCIQLLLTFGIAITMFLVDPIHDFMRAKYGKYVMIASIIVTIILLILMHIFSTRHPWNHLLLFLFTIAVACTVGAVCTTRKGQAVLVAAGLTLLIVIALTIFTFVAAKRGMDLSPFLLCALLLLFAFGLLRFAMPKEKLLHQVLGCVGALVFSGFIIYDTDNIIKRFDYDQYIEAAAGLYLDIINLFMALLSIGR
ncbi:hypothetical protein BUALT_Bualt12G0136200 [Buddleja alternifolia]|uniref:Uncharacterized protein n=1 Tax=Buddleja alternifolia TaxID=168488 RepID=A0AAV6WXC7_9LAMI|nr:hypothetical protein BUALT_Bualt12G0136200 [Buddleja alternifolia]